MILVDISQIFYSNISNRDGIVSEDVFRGKVMNTLRSFNQQFSFKYGEMVICCDSQKYWRKEFFPHYKAHRKAERKRIEINWDEAFEIMHKVENEIKDYLPYKLIKLDGAEADDVIYTLCKNFHDKSPILVVSGDQDFIQLQQFKNVKQYSPKLKSFIISDSPKDFLVEHIIMGDDGDGIPNILSADDVFITKTRQTPISLKRKNNLTSMIYSNIFDDKYIENNFIRNETLINFERIPEEIQESIMKEFDSARKGNKKLLLNYFVENELGNLFSKLQEF